MSLALDVLDAMIRDTAQTAGDVLDAEEPWRKLAPRREIRRALERGIGARLSTLEEARRAIIDAEIAAHEASASDDRL